MSRDVILGAGLLGHTAGSPARRCLSDRPRTYRTPDYAHIFAAGIISRSHR